MKVDLTGAKVGDSLFLLPGDRHSRAQTGREYIVTKVGRTWLHCVRSGGGNDIRVSRETGWVDNRGYGATDQMFPSLDGILDQKEGDILRSRVRELAIAPGQSLQNLRIAAAALGVKLPEERARIRATLGGMGPWS